MKNYEDIKNYNESQCASVIKAEITLREKAEQILSKAYDVLNTAESIHEKLYGPEPVPCDNPGNGNQPYGLSDTLNAIENSIDRLNSSLQDTARRL